MPVLIYTSDFREKDGEVLAAPDVVSNVEDLQDAANGLDWANVEDNSLDVYHTAPGEQPKVAAGQYRPFLPVNSGQWAHVASVTAPVNVGDGVYAVGSVTYDGANMAGAAPGDPQFTNMGSLRITVSTPSPGGGVVSSGQRQHDFMDNPAVHGQGGIVFAYQANQASAATSTDNIITLSVRIASGVLPTTHDIPFRGNLVVFVVHR
jgi:hypothetical protein